MICYKNNVLTEKQHKMSPCGAAANWIFYKFRNGLISLKKAPPKKCFSLAGVAGFEPANAAVKVLCLTA